MTEPASPSSVTDLNPSGPNRPLSITTEGMESRRFQNGYIDSRAASRNSFRNEWMGRDAYVSRFQLASRQLHFSNHPRAPLAGFPLMFWIRRSVRFLRAQT